MARLGVAHQLNELGRHTEARDVFGEVHARIEALTSDAAADNVWAQPLHDGFHGLGDSLEGLGDLDGADAAHRSGLAVAERFGVPALRAFSQQQLGQFLARRGDLAGGRAALTAARAEYLDAGDRFRLAEVDAALAALPAAPATGS